MENHTNIQPLKVKEINRSYYLKRAIIFSLITTIGTPYARFIGGFIVFLADKNANVTNNVDELSDAVGAWVFGNAISLVIWLIFVVLTIYYAVKSWKADKEYQELITSVLTKIDMREEKRNYPN